MIRFISFSIIFITLFSLSFYIIISSNLNTQINKVSLEIEDLVLNKDQQPISLKLGVIGDIHTPENDNSYAELIEVLSEVNKYELDLLLFVGDYTNNPRKVLDFNKHRSKLVKILTSVPNKPSVFILGNYETWSKPVNWINEFKKQNANILENEISILSLSTTDICIRGLGDFYTKRFKYVEFPETCKNKPKITITHDPAGAFNPKIRGFVVSGHTHCGQISFPIIGPIWIPSEVPREAHCGLYKDNQRTVFTTSGIGTTILPIRIGTQSEWDLLTVNFK